MRIRLLTTAAALALFAAMAGPGAVFAAGETPTSNSGAAVGNSTSPSLAPSGISTNSSGSLSSGSSGTSASMSSSVPIDSTVGGPLMIGTQGLLLPPDYATGARVFYRSYYIGAPYETSMGGTEHARRALDGELQGSRYQALAREIQVNAGETRSMADRNGKLFDPSAEEFLDID